MAGLDFPLSSTLCFPFWGTILVFLFSALLQALMFVFFAEQKRRARFQSALLDQAKDLFMTLDSHGENSTPQSSVTMEMEQIPPMFEKVYDDQPQSEKLFNLQMARTMVDNVQDVAHMVKVLPLIFEFAYGENGVSVPFVVKTAMSRIENIMLRSKRLSYLIFLHSCVKLVFFFVNFYTLISIFQKWAEAANSSWIAQYCALCVTLLFHPFLKQSSISFLCYSSDQLTHVRLSTLFRSPRPLDVQKMSKIDQPSQIKLPLYELMWSPTRQILNLVTFCDSAALVCFVLLSFPLMVVMLAYVWVFLPPFVLMLVAWKKGYLHPNAHSWSHVTIFTTLFLFMSYASIWITIISATKLVKGESYISALVFGMQGQICDDSSFFQFNFDVAHAHGQTGAYWQFTVLLLSWMFL